MLHRRTSPQPPPRRSAAWALPLLGAFTGLLLACESTPGASSDPGAAASAPSTAQASPSGSAATAGTGSAPSTAPAHPHAGAWEGRYKAAKGTVTVPEGVRYKSWAEDKGEEHIGEGRIALQVAADGVVRGSASGALGEQTIIGRIDGDMLRTSVQAVDPQGGMSGILTGPLKGAQFEARLRVSDARGNLVRQSVVTLARAAAK